jgi:hypothetical protein
MLGNQANIYNKNTEFFLLASFSALPTVMSRLVDLDKRGMQAVLFCFSLPMYKFLHPLMQTFSWINVVYIDIAELILISPYRPWKIWRARILLMTLYSKWFAKIPPGSVLHFYNSNFALPVFYMIWQLRNVCEIHYADCDLTKELIYKQKNNLYSWIKLIFLYIIYQMPIKIVARKNDVKPFASLADRFFEKTVKVRSEKVIDFTQLRLSNIFQSLMWKSNAKILWLMTPVIDYKLVVPGKYEQILENCAHVVDSIYPMNEQKIKFHPRTIRKETVWDPSIERVPEYIAVEFLDLPNLKAVLTISSSAVMNFLPEINIIGLVDIIPFVSHSVYTTQKDYFLLFSSNSKRCCPASMEDLRRKLTDICIGESL